MEPNIPNPHPPDSTGVEIFPLMSIALDWLQPSKREKYTFHPKGPEALQLGLEMLFQSRTDPVPALHQLVNLAVALREAGAPKAARTIAGVIRGCEAAQKLLRLGDMHALQLKAERLLHGAPKTASAAPFAARAPAGSVRLSTIRPPRTKIR